MKCGVFANSVRTQLHLHQHDAIQNHHGPEKFRFRLSI